MAKSARVPRGCDVARKATWQSHADPRSAPTWRYIYIIILSYIIEVFVLPYMGRVIPVVTVGSYKPDGFEITLRVGLIHKFFLNFRRRGTHRSVGSTGARRSHALIAWARSTDQDQHACAIKGVITAILEPRGGISCADRVDAWSADHGRSIKTRAVNQGVITAQIKSHRENLDRQIKNKRARSERFL